MKNKGGNQAKKKGRKNIQKKTYSLDDLVKGPNEDYAFVTNRLGDGRFNVICGDKVTRLGIVRGKIRNSCRLDKGSLALISIREFEDSKCDILYEYSPDDVDKLLKNNKVTESFVKTGKLVNPDEQRTFSDIQFTENINLDSSSDESEDVWDSDDSNDNKHEVPIKTKTKIKAELNIDSDSCDEELDINDI